MQIARGIDGVGHRVTGERADRMPTGLRWSLMGLAGAFFLSCLLGTWLGSFWQDAKLRAHESGGAVEGPRLHV